MLSNYQLEIYDFYDVFIANNKKIGAKLFW